MTASVVASPARVWHGFPASGGVAVGPAVMYDRIKRTITRRSTRTPDQELERLRSALDALRKALDDVRQTALHRAGADEAAIFEAHLGWLDDPSLKSAIEGQIREGLTAEAAAVDAFDAYAAQLEAAGDDYFRERASDLRDLRDQIVDHLVGKCSQTTVLFEPSVVIARELTPSDTLTMDSSKVLAFCTATGGPTSHAAILARSLQIPAVVGIGENLLSISAGTILGVDGSTGEVVADPPQELIQSFAERRSRLQDQSDIAQREGQAPAITLDGRRVEVVANIGSLAEAQQAFTWGAEGVGLLRTEFLYVNRETAPSEDEQFEQYRAIADVVGMRPLIIRTLDIGGDKPVPYLPVAPEANPFLGFRAIRIGLAEPDILETQLRAILRIGPGHKVKIMFPMIADAGEVRRARRILEHARAELRQAAIPIADPVELGVMIEIPSAAILADQLARVVDFFSIGTNDLTQYTLAADRTNERIAPMYDALHPGVLRLIKRVIDAAHTEHKWVGLCGELAGDPAAAPVLLGMSLDEFSCAAPAIPALKARLRTLETATCQRLANAALECDSPAAVRELLATSV